MEIKACMNLLVLTVCHRGSWRFTFPHDFGESFSSRWAIMKYIVSYLHDYFQVPSSLFGSILEGVLTADFTV